MCSVKNVEELGRIEVFNLNVWVGECYFLWYEGREELIWNGGRVDGFELWFGLEIMRGGGVWNFFFLFFWLFGWVWELIGD